MSYDRAAFRVYTSPGIARPAAARASAAPDSGESRVTLSPIVSAHQGRKRDAALLIAYPLFHRLSGIRLQDWMLAQATLPHVCPRPHEPAITLEDLKRRTT